MRTLIAYLQLCRAANIFTAFADIFTGYLLSHHFVDSATPFAWLLAASGFLYASGMVWNDLFDRDIDAKERPGRPIPSRRISVAAAARLAVGLNVLGLVAAGLAGMPSLVVAVLITACVLAYDGGMKRTPLGPLFMGACRFFNVLLGASAGLHWTGDPAAFASQLFAPPHVVVAFGMGLYIVGVTWFARQEAERSARPALIGAAIVLNVGLAVLVAWLHFAPDPLRRGFLCTVALCFSGVTINRRLSRAVQDPSPQNVQNSVRTMLLSYVMLHAALTLFAAPQYGYAIAVIALLVPPMLLRRVLPMT